MTIYNTPAQTTKARYSLPAIVALIAAVASFVVSPGFGFILALIAIAAGAIGLMLAVAPSVRGGMISFISIAAGLIGIIAAVLRLIF